MFTFPKPLLALTLFAALAVMPTSVLRAQWVQTNGPYQSGMKCFAVNGTDIFTATIYSDSSRAGVYRSTDNGQSWFLANAGLPIYIAVNALATSGSDLFAGLAGHGVYHSTNQGASWVWASSGLTDSSISSLFIFDGNLYAGTNSGVFRSTNNGTSWGQFNTGLSSVSLDVYNFGSDGTTIYAGTQGGVYGLTANGSSWTNLGLVTTSPEAYTVASLRAFLYVGTPVGIYRSTNSGSSWAPESDGLPVNTSVRAFAVVDTNIYAGTLAGIYRLKGNEWIAINDGLTDLTINALTVIGSNLFAATYNGGVFSLSAGSSVWNTARAGLPSNAGVVAVASFGTRLFAATDGAISYSDDDGAIWTQTESVVQNVRAFSEVGDYLFAASYDSGVYRSTDNGVTWNSTNNGFANPGAVGLLTNQGVLYAQTWSGIRISYDTGANWTLPSGVDSLISSDAVMAGNVLAIFFDTIYSTTDNGGDWSQMTILLPTYPDELDPINLGPLTGVSIFLFAAANYDDSGYGLHQLVLRSSDNGANWEEINTTFHHGVNSFFAVGSSLFAMVDDSIFFTTDYGVTWIEADGGLPSSVAFPLGSNGIKLYAGTDNSGLWRRPLSDFGISSVTQALQPAPFDIQSYPNPLSQSTSITFTLPEASEVTLTISDATGRETPLLRSAWFPAGQHEITWDASNYPSGVYLCRLSSNGESVTERVVVLK
jgi:Secretion system C-terminal sorting domain